MRVADLIAYVNHDIDDAVRAGLLQEADLPQDAVDVLGLDLVGADRPHGQGRRHRNAGRRPDRDPHERRRCWRRRWRLRAFLFDAVYENEIATAEFKKADRHPRRSVGKGPRAAGRVPRPAHHRRRRPRRRRAGFLAGMTDRYAVRLFERLFIPEAVGRGR